MWFGLCHESIRQCSSVAPNFQYWHARLNQRAPHFYWYLLILFQSVESPSVLLFPWSKAPSRANLFQDRSLILRLPPARDGPCANLLHSLPLLGPFEKRRSSANLIVALLPFGRGEPTQ